MTRIITHKSGKNMALRILCAISFIIIHSQTSCGMEASGVTSSQSTATPEETQGIPSPAEESHQKGIVEPNENDEFYKRRESLFSLPKPLPIPLTEINGNRFEWSMIVANEVNPYFSQPYADNPNDKLLCTDGIMYVYRPNHSLAHGLRQAYLAVDIVVFLKNAVLSQEERQEKTPGNALRQWVIKKLKADSQFLKKIEFANAFQRSGRQSDISKDTNEAKYNEYLMNDKKKLSGRSRKAHWEPF
jgi:hypothetical protein